MVVGLVVAGRLRTLVGAVGRHHRFGPLDPRFHVVAGGVGEGGGGAIRVCGFFRQSLFLKDKKQG